jgi:hypothetical protein
LPIGWGRRESNGARAGGHGAAGALPSRTLAFHITYCEASRHRSPATIRAVTAALIIIGAPGSGKTSVLDALCTLLEIEGVEFGAIESEQLARGWPWLTAERWTAQLAAVISLQRDAGRRLGKAELIEHARALASVIPTIPGIDLAIATDDREAIDAAAELRDTLRAAVSV